jgi:tetratricopeptide (TPR) repeat protein
MPEERMGRRAKVPKPPAPARVADLPDQKAHGKAGWHLLVLAAVSLALYADALRNGFVTDDTLQLQDNPFVMHFRYIPRLFATNVWSSLHSTLSNYYRPLQMLFYMGEYHLFGFRPGMFHLVNLLLNVAAVFAAYFLIRAFADESLALWVALLFAFHPIHVEVVVWIAALPELLCAICYFTAMRFYHRARIGGDSARDHGIATAIFFVGLFCKETMIVFPAVLLAYEFFYRRESLRAICLDFRRFLPYLCALGVYLAIRVRVLGSFAPTSARLTNWQVFLTVPVLLCQYILKLLWPVNMNYFYYFTPQNRLDWKFVASVALIGALVVAMFWMRKSRPLLSFALAWFFIVMAPVLYISHVGENVFTERYLYIPSLGFCILVVWIWFHWEENLSRRMAITLAYPALALVLVFYAVLIALRIPDWRSDLRLFQRTVLQSPTSPAVQGSLGVSYYEAGQYDLAIPPLERSLALKPNSSLVHLYLALTLSDLGDSQEARAHLSQAEELNKDRYAPWALYGQAHANLNEWDRAIEYDRKEIELEPQNPVLYTALGEALQKTGQTEDSIAAFRQAIQLDPGFLDASINLAITLAEGGNTDDAIALLLSALRSHPDGPHADAAWFNLGNMYAHKRDWNAAADAYQHALDVNPDLTAARQRLESVAAEQAAHPQ